MPYEPAASVLENVRVLDMTRVRSGPTAVRQLADWGADVIRIEQPEALEPDGSLGAARHTADFQNLQRNKRSLTLNLKSEEGLALFRKLADTADVIVENFRPDVKQRLGIDYEALSKTNDRLIYASISGFGQTGPYAKRPGFDQVAQGMGGLMSITGAPGEGPMRVGIPIADLCAGHFCAQGILLALYERERSGKGQWLHTSLLQAMIAMLDFQAARWTVNGEIPVQAGNNHPTSIPTGVFETADGFINIAVAGEATWARFCESLDKQEWQEHPDYSSNKLRSENRHQLNELITQVTKTKTSEDWIAAFGAGGVPCGPIYTIDKTFDDPQVKHLNMTSTVSSPVMGDISLINQPVVLDRTPSSIKVAPPERGNDTEDILTELGVKTEEFNRMREAHII
ncbi:MAG: CoA transferase [Gammaproteobacteria bacterium]|nr:CoA transferase [Gammaproteobacteria bacterium]